MIGIDERTGKLISGEKYLHQSLRRVLKTFKGSMRMHRWFGTNLRPYLAKAMTEQWLLDLTSEAVQSIERSIPGVNVEAVQVEQDGDGAKLVVNVVWKSKPYQVGVNL